MLNAPKQVEVNFIVTIYKDMELADEIETVNSFYTYESALSFYNEAIEMYGNEQYIDLSLEIETDGNLEIKQLAHNYTRELNKEPC